MSVPNRLRGTMDVVRAWWIRCVRLSVVLWVIMVAFISS